jgi:hypothetical protein
MIAMTTTPYAGWWRANRKTPWTRLVTGDGYDAAWERLLDALATVHGGESIVLRADADPNVRRRIGERRGR